MKSVSRSAYDPLPRFLSGRSQALLTVVLIVGIGVSVFEYLESSRHPVRAGAATVERGPVECAPVESGTGASSPTEVVPARAAPAACVRARSTAGAQSSESVPGTWRQACTSAAHSEEPSTRTSAAPMSFEPGTETGG